MRDNVNISYEELQDCTDELRRKIHVNPAIGVVLGSGLGNFINQMKVTDIIPYSDVSIMKTSTVEGHAGRFVFGHANHIPVVVMQGRLHYYEGYTMEEVVCPIRLMKLLGIKVLIILNAAGGIREDLIKGDLMLITDHISSFVPSPLIGPNIDQFGMRFPNMSNVYHQGIQDLVKEIATNLHIQLKEGVYVQVQGPNFETPAEIKLYKAIGADAVGMSTSCEAMAACHMNLPVCGISYISNVACKSRKHKITYEEVSEGMEKIQKDLDLLLLHMIQGIYEYDVEKNLE